MTYNVFGGTLSLTQSIILAFHKGSNSVSKLAEMFIVSRCPVNGYVEMALPCGPLRLRKGIYYVTALLLL